LGPDADYLLFGNIAFPLLLREGFDDVLQGVDLGRVYLRGPELVIDLEEVSPKRVFEGPHEIEELVPGELDVRLCEPYRFIPFSRDDDLLVKLDRRFVIDAG